MKYLPILVILALAAVIGWHAPSYLFAFVWLVAQLIWH